MAVPADPTALAGTQCLCSGQKPLLCALCAQPSELPTALILTLVLLSVAHWQSICCQVMAKRKRFTKDATFGVSCQAGWGGKRERSVL